MNAPTMEEAWRVEAMQQALQASGVPTRGGPHYMGAQAAVYHLEPRPEMMARALRQVEAIEAAIDQPVGGGLVQLGRHLLAPEALGQGRAQAG